MPSGSRLLTGLLFALAMMGCVYLAAFHEPALMGDRNRLFGLAAGLGFFFGWTMLGSRLGKGFARTAGRSLATMAIAGFWFFAFLAARSVVLPMLNQVRLYPEPIQALEALVDRFMVLIGYAADPRILIAAVLGALIAGAIGEYSRMIWN